MFSLGLGTPSALVAASSASGPAMPQQSPPSPLVLNPMASVSQFAQCLSVSSGTLANGLLLVSSDAGLTELSAITAGGVGQPGSYGLVQRTALPEFTRELQLAAQEAGIASGLSVELSVATFVSLVTPGECNGTYSTVVELCVTGVCGAAKEPFALRLAAPMAVAGTAELAGQQHEQLAALLGPTGLAGMVASYAGTPAPVVLPSGLPMQTQDSVYSLCRDELGPRPSFQGITDPCDYSVAQWHRCVYDRRCDALRALEAAKRSMRFSWLGLIGVIAGAIISAPATCTALIGGALLGALGIGGSVLTFLDARDKIEDAHASLDAVDACWKDFLFNNNCGVTP